MKDTEYAYAVANVRAKEPELLTKSFIEQLIDTPTFTDAKKIMVDKGFTGFEKSTDVSDVLADYMIEVWNFLTNVAPDKEVLDFLVVKNDFHNLKAIIKGHISGNDGRKYCIKPSVLDVDFLYNSIIQKEFDNLPKWISGVSKEAYDLLTSTMDGQIFDMYVDVASLKAMINFSKSTECFLAIDYSELFVALANIKIAVRLSGTTKGNAFLENAFCPCETLSVDELKKAVLKGKDDIITYINSTKYSVLSESILKSVADFERECDNMLIKRLDDVRFVNMGPEPLICYYLAKEAEWKMLRIALSGKNIDMPSGSIRERMRELYV